MRLEQIPRRLHSFALKGLVYRLRTEATVEEIRVAEHRLNVEFSEQAASFWKAFDGLEVNDPKLVIVPLAELEREDARLIFCHCDKRIRIAFDISMRNQADQWTIVNADTGYEITLTMASFWSTHIWAWILKRRPFWYDVHQSLDTQ
jgi:hypothetical protein